MTADFIFHIKPYEHILEQYVVFYKFLAEFCVWCFDYWTWISVAWSQIISVSIQGLQVNLSLTRLGGIATKPDGGQGQHGFQ